VRRRRESSFEVGEARDLVLLGREIGKLNKTTQE